MMGVSVLAVHDAELLMKSADIVASLTVEALEGITDAFDERIHHARPHRGQISVARNLLKNLSKQQTDNPAGRDATAGCIHLKVYSANTWSRTTCN